MTGECVFCGAVEEIAGDMSGPLVCDRPECLANAREIGWSLLLEQFIETKRLDDGTMAFRLKPPA